MVLKFKILLQDSELLEFAARQPRQYASMMFDRKQHLWAHSYWVKQKKPYPGRNIFWARGNGWVVCAFPMIIDQIGQDHELAGEIISVYRQTCEALLQCMNPDHTFGTLLKHRSYRELSATALISAGWLHGVRCGYLEEKFKEPAIKAFYACVDAMETTEEGIFMTGISGPTIPMPLFPKCGYQLVPRGKNWSYGIAALIFAAIEYKRIFETKQSGENDEQDIFI